MARLFDPACCGWYDAAHAHLQEATMSRLVALLTGCVLTLTVAGPLHGQSQKVEIEKVIAEFETAFNSKDAATVAELYTEDAAIFPPDGPRIDGREGIGNYWRGAIDAGVTDLALSAIEIEDSGSFTYEVGTFSFQAPTENGASTEVNGQYIVIWTKDADGNWRLHRDIWNTGPTQN
jgi:uncharacterized protein (TIGR02246 family)